MELCLRNECVTWADRYEADFIDALVKNGIVEKGKISKADEILIGELIGRTCDDIGVSGFASLNGSSFFPSPVTLSRVETMFGNRESQEKCVIESRVNDARDILRFLKTKTGLPFVGVIVSGSRIDPEKVVRKDSDLDLFLVVDSDEESVWNPSRRRVWERMVNEERGRGYKVSMNYTYDYVSLASEAEGDSYYFPYWGWNPESFRYVGDLNINGKILSDSFATEYLKQLMKSEKMMKRRREIISMAETEIEKIALCPISKT